MSALSSVRGDASFLQIGVSIQPENSSGPLVNDDGDVIGVVVAAADFPPFFEATEEHIASTLRLRSSVIPVAVTPRRYFFEPEFRAWDRPKLRFLLFSFPPRGRDPFLALPPKLM